MATVTGLCDCVSCAIRRTTVRRAISLKRDRRAGCASCAEHLSVVRLLTQGDTNSTPCNFFTTSERGGAAQDDTNFCLGDFFTASEHSASVWRLLTPARYRPDQDHVDLTAGLDPRDPFGDDGQAVGSDHRRRDSRALRPHRMGDERSALTGHAHAHAVAAVAL